ncbi:2Fe-2S iron-sulfur cluster binding domain-containing protein [Cohnella sp. OV330]|uniref:2Fe-2S iron-sulfur cluster-binding protein n=1 Tax=Cohnella sp. OV330 TaxID=1855288 RepID=UPI0008E65C2C|nr:2Fe-2S iron-sulfur cluster-binding protein [Cohnella sp. OV330]SFB18495.1 2Fe-2S iron-sulfur cluster binding domain-containing protein [Cohnella sp. OV330]
MGDKGGCEVEFGPEGQVANVRPGTTLLEASRRARASVRTRCGGVAGCLMCKVDVPPAYEDALTLPTEAERRKLGPLLEQGVRLSCQARVRRSLRVEIPEDPLKAAVRRQLERQRSDDLW